MNLGIALYGLGTVGSAFVDILSTRRPDLWQNHGVGLELRHVVVRDRTKPRPSSVDPDRIGFDHAPPVEDPAVDIVIEAMGGIEPAATVARRALRAGKHVVTANKALIATHGAELEAEAAASGVALRYEAAVGGAIPVLHALRGALVANRITRIMGILNGTTNYILTRMAQDGSDLGDALARAQALGFAEADPSADISGLDTVHKLVILARHALGVWVDVDSVSVEGIEQVRAEDIADALRRGGELKLIAEAVPGENGRPRLQVRPTAVPASSPLGAVRDENNAVLLEGDFSGPLLFAGPGAGGGPTGSAVYADVVDIARLHAAAPVPARL